MSNLKSKFAFGQKEDVENAINSGAIDEYDVLFLSREDGTPEIGWLDADKNPIYMNDVIDEKIGDIEEGMELNNARDADIFERIEENDDRLTELEKNGSNFFLRITYDDMTNGWLENPEATKETYSLLENAYKQGKNIVLQVELERNIWINGVLLMYMEDQGIVIKMDAFNEVTVIVLMPNGAVEFIDINQEDFVDFDYFNAVINRIDNVNTIQNTDIARIKNRNDAMQVQLNNLEADLAKYATEEFIINALESAEDSLYASGQIGAITKEVKVLRETHNGVFWDTPIPVVAGKTYIVTVDSGTFTSVAEDVDSGNVFLGCYSDKGELVLTYAEYQPIDYAEIVGYDGKTFIVSEEAETIHPIDPKYLPGVCLPVVELETDLIQENTELSANDSLKMDSVAAMNVPVVINFAVGSDMTSVVFSSINGTNFVANVNGANVMIMRGDSGWISSFQLIG